MQGTEVRTHKPAAARAESRRPAYRRYGAVDSRSYVTDTPPTNHLFPLLQVSQASPALRYRPYIRVQISILIPIGCISLLRLSTERISSTLCLLTIVFRNIARNDLVMSEVTVMDRLRLWWDLLFVGTYTFFLANKNEIDIDHIGMLSSLLLHRYFGIPETPRLLASVRPAIVPGINLRRQFMSALMSTKATFHTPSCFHSNPDKYK